MITNFVMFNFTISFINIVLLYVITKTQTFKTIKPNSFFKKVKFLFCDITIYLCLFIIFSIPIFNVIILFIILKEMFKELIRTLNIN